MASIATRPHGSIGVAARGRAATAAIEAWLEAERDQLPLWLPVALGCGIAAWFLLPDPAAWARFLGLAAAVSVGGMIAGGRGGRALVVGGVLAAAGLGLAWGRAELVRAPRLAAERVAVTFEARVLALEDRSGREQWRLFLQPADRTLPPKLRVSMRDPPPAAARPGATIRIRATLRPPPGPSVPGGYDFARRAWFEGLGAVGFALGQPVVLKPAPPPSGLSGWLAHVRAHLTGWLADRVGGQEGAIAAAFTTGDEGRIAPKVAQAMRDSGLAHLLSISGVHIAAVIGAGMVVTRRTLTLSPWIALHWPVKAIGAAAGAVLGVLYTLLAGAEVPTVRSTAAALVVLAGIMVGRSAISLRTVAFAAFAILLVRPEALLGPSFQLSFAAVTGLVAAYNAPALRPWLQPRHDGWLKRAGGAALGLVLSSLVAQAMLAPVAFYHFNREGLYGAAANLLGIPLTSFVIMPALGLTLALGTLGLEAPALWVLKHAMALLVALAEEVARWPGAVARLPTMPTLAFALFVIGGLWLALWAGRARLLGAAPVAAGLALALLARPPDLLVSGDGVHLGLVARDGSLAMLRNRAGPFIRDMWGDAAGTAAQMDLERLPNASCTEAACVLLLDRGGRSWRVLATRSRQLIPRDALQPQCEAADIVVASRRLPPWCAPRWLRLDRAALNDTGALALRLDAAPGIETARGGQGAHPWAVQPAPLPTRRAARGRALGGGGGGG
ncbi:MAG: ComEC/Rec2 family competence protein [Sphingomonadaceae bacterium]|nr:ComEC/Rec2 family competence protein [Sphingomonadaceae bacterium]